VAEAGSVVAGWAAAAAMAEQAAAAAAALAGSTDRGKIEGKVRGQVWAKN
jgi:hypothetical protein